MKQRIITALILAPLVILGIFFLPLPGFIAAMSAVTLLGFWEWTQFVPSRSRITALIPALVVMAASLVWVPLDVSRLNTPSCAHYGILSIGVVWWLVASAMAMVFPKLSQRWQSPRLLRHLFGILTLLPFLWSVLLLRAEAINTDPYHGAKLVLFVCLLVWSADSGAYFAGKSFGKRKMAPNVSPNKTIEGLLGGIVVAMLVSWGAAMLFNITFSSPSSMLIITLVTVVISVLGDLVESMFKRVAGIKDSGSIIPGHGGILDRIDSLTAAFPVFTFLYLIF